MSTTGRLSFCSPLSNKQCSPCSDTFRKGRPRRPGYHQTTYELTVFNSCLIGNMQSCLPTSATPRIAANHMMSGAICKDGPALECQRIDRTRSVCRHVVWKRHLYLPYLSSHFPQLTCSTCTARNMSSSATGTYQFPNFALLSRSPWRLSAYNWFLRGFQ